MTKVGPIENGVESQLNAGSSVHPDLSGQGTVIIVRSGATARAEVVGFRKASQVQIDIAVMRAKDEAGVVGMCVVTQRKLRTTAPVILPLWQKLNRPAPPSQLGRGIW